MDDEFQNLTRRAAWRGLWSRELFTLLLEMTVRSQRVGCDMAMPGDATASQHRSTLEKIGIIYLVHTSCRESYRKSLGTLQTC